MTVDCQEVRDALYVLDGAPSLPEVERARRHLKRCARCRGVLEEIRRFDGALRAELNAREPPPYLEERVIFLAGGRGPTRRLSQKATRLAALGLAATLAVTLAFALVRSPSPALTVETVPSRAAEKHLLHAHDRDAWDGRPATPRLGTADPRAWEAWRQVDAALREDGYVLAHCGSCAWSGARIPHLYYVAATGSLSVFVLPDSATPRTKLPIEVRSQGVQVRILPATPRRLPVALASRDPIPELTARRRRHARLSALLPRTDRHARHPRTQGAVAQLGER